MTQPSEFLPKDRDGALLMIKDKLYDRLHTQTCPDYMTHNMDWARGYNKAIIDEQTFIRNLLDIIERS